MRAFATGVTVGMSLLLRECMGISFVTAALLLGAVTVLYDTLGGMKVVIWSDVIQISLIL